MSSTPYLLPTTCDICKQTISHYPYVALDSDKWTDALLIKDRDHEETAIALCLSRILCIFCYAIRLTNHLHTPIILTETTLTHQRKIYLIDVALVILPNNLTSILPSTGIAKNGPFRCDWVIFYPKQHAP
jgi:hypothetical protein